MKVAPTAELRALQYRSDQLAAEPGLPCVPAFWLDPLPSLEQRRGLTFSPYLYRDRNLVEGFFNKIKQCRRVATRYNKLAANYLAFGISLWLRVYECTA